VKTFESSRKLDPAILIERLQKGGVVTSQKTRLMMKG
jgi:hypothetical protein